MLRKAPQFLLSQTRSRKIHCSLESICIYLKAYCLRWTMHMLYNVLVTLGKLLCLISVIARKVYLNNKWCFRCTRSIWSYSFRKATLAESFLVSWIVLRSQGFQVRHPNLLFTGTLTLEGTILSITNLVVNWRLDMATVTFHAITEECENMRTSHGSGVSAWAWKRYFNPEMERKCSRAGRRGRAWVCYAGHLDVWTQRQRVPHRVLVEETPHDIISGPSERGPVGRSTSGVVPCCPFTSLRLTPS